MQLELGYLFASNDLIRLHLITTKSSILMLRFKTNGKMYFQCKTVGIFCILPENLLNFIKVKCMKKNKWKVLNYSEKLDFFRIF